MLYITQLTSIVVPISDRINIKIKFCCMNSHAFNPNKDFAERQIRKSDTWPCVQIFFPQSFLLLS